MNQEALSWLQDSHYQNGAVEAYHQAFVSHPAQLLVIRNFLKPEGAEKISRFLESEAQYETLYGLYSTMNNDPRGLANATEEDWSKADEKDRFYRLRKFTGISRELQLTPNLVAYMKFRVAFNHPEFRQFFTAVSGLALHPEEATFHSFTMRSGDFLGDHDDNGSNYQLAFVMYFNPRWEARFGGILNMVDPTGNVTKIEPEYNSLVIFEVNKKTKHFVTPIQACASAEGRATISGWMHKPPQDL
jgi:Rps23 Pro-64 3,4-dihydroxylase Tpa1-like proline 4-hydroxylase